MPPPTLTQPALHFGAFPGSHFIPLRTTIIPCAARRQPPFLHAPPRAPHFPTHPHCTPCRILHHDRTTLGFFGTLHPAPFLPLLSSPPALCIPCRTGDPWHISATRALTLDRRPFASKIASSSSAVAYQPSTICELLTITPPPQRFGPTAPLTATHTAPFPLPPSPKILSCVLSPAPASLSCSHQPAVAAAARKARAAAATALLHPSCTFFSQPPL